ncbi:MAG: hypothetical protein IJ544_00050 [Prevotella sp.]|nr:hypothetical protein [Prevotella sp.]
MRKILDEYLEENGLAAMRDDNDVVFSVNGLYFLFRSFPDDPFFFRMFLPKIEDHDVKERRDIIAEINQQFKVAKILEIDNRPWIVADCFVYSKENGHALIGRLIKLLTDVINEYRERVSELDNPETKTNNEDNNSTQSR